LSGEHDLVESLAQAAADAVRARREAIESAGAGSLRGVTVEIETSGKGVLIEATSYLTWKQRMRGKGS
jgi:hypothetical protein